MSSPSHNLAYMIGLKETMYAVYLSDSSIGIIASLIQILEHFPQFGRCNLIGILPKDRGDFSQGFLKAVYMILETLRA